MYYGLPWSRPIVFAYTPFLHGVLARDATLSPEVLRRVNIMHTYLERAGHMKPENSPQHHLTLLYSRSQPFLLFASARTQRIWLLRDENHDGQIPVNLLKYKLPARPGDTEDRELDRQVQWGSGKTAPPYESVPVYDGASIEIEIKPACVDDVL